MRSANLLGIEIGGTKLQAVVGDAQGNIRRTLEIPADSSGVAPAILLQLDGLVRQLVSEHDQPILGIGIGFGGPVDGARGVAIKSNHVSGWEDFSLVTWSDERFRLPCVVGNDTDAAALAEAVCGCGKQVRCVFYSNIGSGIGGGLVVDGQLYSRPRGAMEFGHNRVYSELEKRHGILEEYCSGWSLARRAQQAALANESSLLWELASGDLQRIGPPALFKAWEEGDDSASRVVDDFLGCYGRALSNLIALLNPDVVVIGGGVAQIGAVLLQAIRKRVAQYVYEPFSSGYHIELTSLGKQAVPVGALLLAARSLGLAGDSR